MFEPIQILDHPDDGYVTIEGMNYSHELFRAWAENGMLIGRWFKILKREDGLLVIEECMDATN